MLPRTLDGNIPPSMSGNSHTGGAECKYRLRRCGSFVGDHSTLNAAMPRRVPMVFPSCLAPLANTYRVTGIAPTEAKRLAVLAIPLKHFHFWVYTGQPASARLFLKKRRTSLHLPVQSRSENALTNAQSSTTLHFVIPTEREGSAVLSIP